MAHLWDLGSQALVLLGIFQEVDKLQNLHFGLVTACDILESNASVVFYYLGFGFTHAKGVSGPPTTTTPDQRSPPRGEHDKSNQH